MIRDLLDFWNRLFPEPAYTGGYSYKVNGQWVWFATRQWHLEVPASERRVVPRTLLPAAQTTVPATERTYNPPPPPPIYGMSPAHDLLDAMTGK